MSPPGMSSPSVVLPPPSFTHQPFFSPPAEGAKAFFGGKEGEPSSPLSSMERSIRQVMSKYGAGDLKESALLPSYRSLRRRRPHEENQAVAVTQDENSYKIMVDVRDFAEGSVSVRAVGDEELVVEGIIEKKEEASPSENVKTFRSVSKNFQQRFMFPGLQVEGVTSTVSSDGVLTVRAPRKTTTEKTITYQVLDDASTSPSSLSSLATNKSNKTSTVEESTTSQSNETSQVSSSKGSTTVNESTEVIEETTTETTQSRKVSSTSSAPSVTSQSTKTISQETSQTCENTQQQSSVPSVQQETIKSHIVPIVTGDGVNISSQKTSDCQISKASTVNQQQSTEIFKQTESQQLSSKDSNTSNQVKSVTNVPIGTNSLSQTNTMLDSIFKNSLVPIDNKGLFFQDSFFENSRRHFQDAVDKVMKRVSTTETGKSDPMSWYNTHRTSSLLEDARAGTISEEERDYKIILDVRDFEEGSVNVRAVGNSEILVEGMVEKKTEGTSISKRFRRRFVMPGAVQCESITSALSSDGVLTITAPKQDTFKLLELTGENANMTKNALTNSSIFGVDTPSCASPNISLPASSVTSPIAEPVAFQPAFSKIQEEKSVSEETSVETSNTRKVSTEQKVQSSNKQQLQTSTNHLESSRGDHIVPINVDQSSSVNTGEKIVNINYIDKNQSEIDAMSTSSNVNTETNQHEQRQQQYQLIGNVKDLTDVNLKENVKQRKSSQSQSSRDIAIRYDDPSSLVFPPIIRRGPFYQDSFFSGVHNNFQSAIRKVLDEWVDVPSVLFSNRNDSSSLCNFDRFENTLSNYRSILDCDSFDDLTCYKNLRHRSLREENQASSLKENDNDFQIVLDVHGFSENDMSIRAVSHNELIVEGKVQSSSQGTQSSHSFRKQFILPGPVRMEAVHSALSADDILTITVPKNNLLRITHTGSS